MKPAAHGRRMLDRFAWMGAAFAIAAELVSPAGAAPLIAGDIYTESLSTSCSRSSLCSLPFTAVPAGNTLAVESVGCRITIPSRESVRELKMIGNGKTMQLDPGAPTTIGGTKIFFVNLPVLVPYVAGSRPRIRVRATRSNITLECAISGRLVADPN